MMHPEVHHVENYHPNGQQESLLLARQSQPASVGTILK
jgi:hypothetical protein